MVSMGDHSEPRTSSITNSGRTGNEGNLNVDPLNLDTLGEFIDLDTNYLVSHDNNWTSLFHKVKGRSNFSPNLVHLQHDASPLLLRYATQGVPVVLDSKPWDLSRKDAAMLRGNHPSTAAFADFITEEMTEMRSKGIFIVLPYETVRSLEPLRISPLGCVPQRERRPQIINDYTFSGVNPSTLKMAPQESMQWGRTLQRILWYIFSADTRHGPVLLSKTDLSDGFYQLHLNPSGALKLAVPFDHRGQRLVAIPTRLLMGWTESPPTFSAVTETIADVINHRLEASPLVPPAHPFEAKASTMVALDEPQAQDAFPLKEAGPKRPPLAYVDVYVNDFVKLAQGSLNSLRLRQHAYHAIDETF